MGPRDNASDDDVGARAWLQSQQLVFSELKRIDHEHQETKIEIVRLRIQVERAEAIDGANRRIGGIIIGLLSSVIGGILVGLIVWAITKK
jgi:hypothetical protein